MNSRYGFNPKAGPSHSGLSHRDNRAALGLNAAAQDDEPTYSTYSPYGAPPSRTESPYDWSQGSQHQSNQKYSQARTAEELEGQNDEHLEGLTAKVRILKDITKGIGSEVRDSTKFLDGMNDTFGETSGLLGGTFQRMSSMAKKQGSRWWYWMLFIIVVFWIFFFRWLGII